jgi:hypothetical protein
MHKRPIIKKKRPAPVEFVMEFRGNGTQVGTWAPKVTSTRIPNGTPGRVGEIIDAMRRGVTYRQVEKPWSPPIDYEFVAKHMLDETKREIYLKRCRDWCTAHPPPPPRPPVVKPVINIELILDLYKKYEGKAPPIGERIKVLRDAGYSAEHIAKKLARIQKNQENASEIQKAIDDIWTATAKAPRGKVIKAVKKRA